MHIIDEAIDLGINFFDTADLDDYGLNEEFVEKPWGKKRPNLLQPKVGNVGQKKKMAGLGDPSKAYIKTEVNGKS